MARYRKGQGGLFRRKKNRKVVGNFFFKFDGRAINTGTDDKAEAERFRNSYVGRVADGIIGSHRRGAVTVDALLDLLAGEYRVRGQNLVTLGCRLKHLRPHMGKRNAQTLLSADIRAYADTREREGAAEATINRELSALHKALAIGRDEDLITKVPSFRTARRREENIRKGFVEQPDFERLLECLKEPVRLMAIICRYTGWRAGRVISLRWDQIDFERNIITPPERQAGNKTVGAAPIFGELKRALLLAQIRHEQRFPQVPYVIHRAGRCLQGHSSYRYAWIKGTEAAGLSGLLVHDLRRTAWRELFDATKSEAKVKKIIGHATAEMVSRYLIQADSDVSNLADELEQKDREKRSESTNREHFGSTLN